MRPPVIDTNQMNHVSFAVQHDIMNALIYIMAAPLSGSIH
jgi:hypothetical protein